MPALRRSIALAGALAAASLTAGTAWAGESCSAPGYSYGGLVGKRGAHGISTVLTALERPVVEKGHAAAWVGVGARHEGPGGADEWLQVGLNSLPGTGNRLYYEYVRPGTPITYVELDSDVVTGRALRIAVLEMSGRKDAWRVWVDGRSASDPITLPGSHDRLTPAATAENWDGGASACNSYSYRFEGLRLAKVPGGVWRPLKNARLRRDSGHRVTQSSASFAAAVGSRPAAPAQEPEQSQPAAPVAEPVESPDPGPAPEAPESQARGRGMDAGVS